MNMNKKIRRTKGKEWVEARVELKDGRLSITGTYGTTITRAEGRKQAKEYWKSFFDDSPEERRAMAEKFNRRLSTSSAAAQFVVDTDGEFHGLDVHDTDGNDLLISEGGGCVHDKLAEWFPELAPAIPWHLNDMKAGCEHQDAWPISEQVELVTYKLTSATLRQQLHLKALGEEALAKGETYQYKPEVLEIVNLPYEVVLPSDAPAPAFSHYEERKREKKALGWLRPDEHPRGVLGKPCPTCGYKYGSGWLKRELPAEIVKLVTDLKA